MDAAIPDSSTFRAYLWNLARSSLASIDTSRQRGNRAVERLSRVPAVWSKCVVVVGRQTPPTLYTYLDQACIPTCKLLFHLHVCHQLLAQQFTTITPRSVSPLLLDPTAAASPM